MIVVTLIEIKMFHRGKHEINCWFNNFSLIRSDQRDNFQPFNY